MRDRENVFNKLIRHGYIDKIPLYKIYLSMYIYIYTHIRLKTKYNNDEPNNNEIK